MDSYAGGRLCAQCRSRLRLVRPPYCVVCGRAFASRAGSMRLCGRCLLRLPRYDRARSVGLYAGSLREAVHELKYRGRTAMAVPLSELLAGQGARMGSPHHCDVLVPVPLHVRRLRQRGFNQSALLAQRLARAWHIPCDVAALQRQRWTAPQTGLDRRRRLANLRGAFAASRARCRGKRMLLIDDVYTSGATVNECARALKAAGAARVEVLTLARTCRER